MFDFINDLTYDLTYETKVGLVIVVLLTIVGCIMYTMKDRLFVKKVEFNPVVEIMDDKQDKEYIPSNSFTGRKPGYVFKTDEQGLGYYRDKIEMEKLK
tara:strand:- start:264 stop:557 length:294 start_codon:yes stop_codon:yes gene_type:complete